MHLLIDGYNLMHAASIVASSAKGRSLERSRLALLNFVAESVEASLLPGTTVVFDAAGAPPGLPSAVEHRGLQVRFAKGYASADELIEELIAAESAPRRLTVVSSDHRIQRAARRRRATAIDSDVWYHETVKRRTTQSRATSEPPVSRTAPSAEEVEYWLRLFDVKPPADQRLDDAKGDAIFPPGYAEDAEEDET